MSSSTIDNQNPIRIFYFEDNPGDVRLIQERLKEGFQEGFKFEYSDRIEAGIEKLTQFNPDVILLDLSLVDSEGKETFNYVQEQNTARPIIIISENKDKNTAIQLIDRGAQDYLVKGTIDDDNLYRAINYSIERKAHELKIKHLNIVQKTIRNIDRLITKENNKERLLQKVCNRLVATEGYLSAWILTYGDEIELYLDEHQNSNESQIRYFKDMIKNNNYPSCVEKLLANKSAILIEKPETECKNCPFVNFYTHHSRILAKLGYEQEDYGIISVSIPDPYKSYNEEIDLFKEIASDIAFGIKDINTQIEHRKSEKALRRSQRHHKEAQQVANIGHWELYPNKGILDWSEQIFSIFHISLEKEEPTFNQWLDYFVSSDREKLKKAIKEAEKKGKEFQLTLSISITNNRRWIQIIGQPKKDKKGNVKKIFGTIQDISLREKAKEELKTERNFLKQITETSPVCITKVNKTGKITFANDRAEEVLGLSKSNIKGKTYNDPRWGITDFNGNSLPDEKLPYEIVKRTGQPVYEVKHAIKFPDGNRKLLSINAAPLNDSNGQFNGIVAVIEDITKRIKAEEDLKNTKERLQLAIKGGELGTWDWNLQTDEVIFNNRWANMLGYELKEIKPHISAWEELVHPDDLSDVQDILNKHLQGKTDFYESEFRMRHKSGKWIWIQDRGKVINRDSQGNPLRACGTHMDISDRKKAEKKQKHLNQKLKNKNKELEQFLYATSHDLRTPLVNIKGFNKELEQSINNLQSLFQSQDIPEDIKEKCAYILEEDIPESIHFILSSASKMDTLLTGLLSLSRLGQKELNIEKLDVNKIIEEVLSNFEYEIKNNDIKLEIDNLPPCRGDESQMNRVFSNLISNALKYLDPERKGYIKIFGHKDNNFTYYSVEDNGIGMPDSQQKKIFDLFHQNDPKKSGIGLGLNIVKQIIDRHNGNIEVESETGQGTKFTISLPNNSN
jgi:PAS domain S-box-containing protein